MNNAYVYVIDDEDRIVSISDNWLSFASENKAEESCHPAKILNQSIWQCINGIETTQLYKICITNVRLQQKMVVLPFRCDSPERRRYLELKISPLPQNYIQFSSCIVREEPRESVQLLQRGLPRSDTLLPMCSMCKKIKISIDYWLEVEAAITVLRLFEEEILPSITHGICPDCFKIAMAEIDKLRS
jgi:hypothetical protein